VPLLQALFIQGQMRHGAGWTAPRARRAARHGPGDFPLARD
jgi:hypothetical protein